MNIYLDENLSEYIAQALHSLNKGHFIDVFVLSTKEKFGKGIPDEELIPKIGKESAILITRDIQISKTQMQYELCKKHKLGVFFISMPKNQNSHWEIVKTIIRNWEEMVTKCKDLKTPFAFKVKPVGRLDKM